VREIDPARAGQPLEQASQPTHVGEPRPRVQPGSRGEHVQLHTGWRRPGEGDALARDVHAVAPLREAPHELVRGQTVAEGQVVGEQRRRMHDEHGVRHSGPPVLALVIQDPALHLERP
jgi:hypothetical protein